MSYRTADESKRRHAVIAGTGRAGTTFLVQFLDSCGIETGSTSRYDERANAGLEIPLHDSNAPYLTKDPWFYLYCESLDLQEIHIDVLILPMRDLAEATSSRLVQEKSRVIEGMPDHFALADSYGVVPGGSIYSLEPLDLERILATGFYRVLYWAVSHDIPIIFLDFPRLVEESAYLIDQLWPWLSQFSSRENAERAFTRTARTEKVTARGSGQETVSESDFRALQLVIRDLQRELVEVRDVRNQLQLVTERYRLEKVAMENSRLWRFTKVLRKLVRRAS